MALPDTYLVVVVVVVVGSEESYVPSVIGCVDFMIRLLNSAQGRKMTQFSTRN